MKRKILTFGVLISAMCGIARDHVADSFLQSSGQVANHFKDDYLPLTTAPKIRPNGSVLRYSMPLDPFQYVIVDFPEKGRFYGLVKTDDVVGGSYIYSAGQNIDVDTTTIIFNQPWDMKSERKTPDGTYYVKSRVDMNSLQMRFMAEGVYNYNTNQRTDPNVTTSVTFSPGGRVTYKSVITYTTQVGQEVEGQVTTTQRVNGIRRKKTTTSLTGGWYFDVKGTITYTGTWKIQNGMLTMNFNEKPAKTVTTAFNREALIDKWRKDSYRRGIEFKMDAYERQYLAQAQADYPNYRVAEEKEILKDWMSEITAPTDLKGHVVFGPDVLLLVEVDKGTTQFFKEEGRQFSADPAFNLSIVSDRLKAVVNHKPDGEAIYRSMLADSLVCQLPGYKALCPNMADWRLTAFNPEDKTVEVTYLDGEGSAKNLWVAKAPVDGFTIDLNQLKSGATESYSMEGLLQRLSEGRAFLENALTDKSYKKGKKIAKDFFKNHSPELNLQYSNLGDFERVRQDVNRRIEYQDEAISAIRQKITR